MEAKTQLRYPGWSAVQPRSKKNHRIKTLVIYTAICCLFSVALAAQQNDTPDEKTSVFNSNTSLSWASKYNNMGMVYIKNKQFKEAYDAFMAYEKCFPNEGLTYRNWAVYYALQHKKERALMFLQRAVELGYDDAQWLETDHSMLSLRNESAFKEMLKKLESK